MPVKQFIQGVSLHKHDRLLLIGILVVGSALRLYRLDAFGIWRDEAQTIFLARHSFPYGILQALQHADVSPPLYYFFLHFWGRIFASDWGLRFFSVIFGVAILPLLYGLGRKICDRDVAILAAYIAVLLPHHIIVSRTVRMYSLLPLVSLLAIYFVYQFVTVSINSAYLKVERSTYLGIILSFAFLLYLHNVGAFLVLSANCFVVWEMLRHKATRNLFRPWLLTQVCVALLYLPWVPMLIRQLRLQGAVMGPWLPHQSRLGNFIRLFSELTALTWPGGRPWLWIVLFVLGAFTIRIRREMIALYLRFSIALDLILFCSIGPVLFAALFTPRTIGIIPSYVTLVAFPAVCYLIARGVSAIRPRVLSLLVLTLLSVLWLRTVSVTYVHPASSLREVAAYVSARAEPDDCIVIAPDYLASTFNYYYSGLQKQVAFPSSFGRVEEITWLHWADNWKDAASFIEPTLQYLVRESKAGARLWFIAPLGAYPNDPYFSQIRVLKNKLDEAYGPPQVVDSFPPAVECAEVYIYRFPEAQGD